MTRRDDVKKAPGDKRPPGRKPYAKPALVKYGEVRSLTQAASGTMTEPGGGVRMPSERRIKEGIVRIGTHPLGIGIFLFDYRAEHRDLFGHGRQFGVMAEDVERVLPEAVGRSSSGFKAVDYAMLGMRQTVR